MRLRKIYVRYYPPGIRLAYTEESGQKQGQIEFSRDEHRFTKPLTKNMQQKTIDLLHLGPETNLRLLVNQLMETEPRLLKKGHKDTLTTILHGLIDKQCHHYDDSANHFAPSKVLKPHAQPLTNIAVSKAGNIIASSSYDKTARVLFQRHQRSSSSSSTTTTTS
jgi:dynein assembly factor with WDR repeat domains 1